MKVCPLCRRRYSEDREVCEVDGATLKEVDPVVLDGDPEFEDTTNRVDDNPEFEHAATNRVDENPEFEHATTNRVDENPEFEDVTTKRRGTKEKTGSVDDMQPLLEVEVSTAVDDAPPAAVRELDGTAKAKGDRGPDPDEALKPLPIASPRSGDHELDDDETAPVEGPTNVVDDDVPTRVAEPDPELRAQLRGDGPDPLPPIKDADRIIEAAQRRVASERIQHQLKQLKTGQLAPTPPSVAAAPDKDETEESTTETEKTEKTEESEEEATPIVVPTEQRDAEDDTVKVVPESVVLTPPVVRSPPSPQVVSTEKVRALQGPSAGVPQEEPSAVVPQEEPSAVVPLARAPVPTEIALPLPPPQRSKGVFWVTLIIVAIVCLGLGFILGRTSLWF